MVVKIVQAEAVLVLDCKWIHLEKGVLRYCLVINNTPSFASLSSADSIALACRDKIYILNSEGKTIDTLTVDYK